ncbi:MAG TPA: MBL fold metallo-hydrolase [Thermoanaerobaculia bacterium]|nr:MBL fold metallo-hydrolase [Thermoanaerobaculia bacterium]
MRNGFMVALALSACAALAQQQDFGKVEVKAVKVAGTVYMITGSGGNIGVSVGDDGIVIVDDQFAPLAPKIIQALNGITDKPIKFIINTHFHGDHTGGNDIFGRTGTIIAHDNVRKRLATGSTGGGRSTPPAPKQALPIVTFNDTATIHVNGEDIRAVHFPNGHTDGDAVIYFPQSNVVHMGDDFFNGHFPFIDVENGGSVKGLIADLDRILATLPDDVKVIPGHGELSDKAGLRRFADMLRGTSSAVEKAMKAGRTVEQMKADKILAQWDDWGKNWFMNSEGFTEALYRDLSRK